MQLTPDQHLGTGYLGLFVRFDTYIGTRENVLRVLVRGSVSLRGPLARVWLMVTVAAAVSPRRCNQALQRRQRVFLSKRTSFWQRMT